MVKGNIHKSKLHFKMYFINAPRINLNNPACKYNEYALTVDQLVSIVMRIQSMCPITRPPGPSG